jgi:hypothetical protein
MPVSKLPSVAVAECAAGPEFDQVTVSPAFTVTAPGENSKSLISTPVEAAATAVVLGFATGAAPRGGWGSGAGATGAGAAGAGAGSAAGARCGAGAAGGGAGAVGCAAGAGGASGGGAGAGAGASGGA